MPKKNLSDQFASEMVSHAVDLHRYAEGVRENVVGNLEQLSNDIERKLRGAKPLTVFAETQNKKLLAWSKDTIATAYDENAAITHSKLVNLAEVEALGQVKLTNKVFGSQVMRNGLTSGDLEEMVGKSMIQGAPQEAWWAKQSVDLQNRFAQQIRLGVAAGENNDQLVTRIIGAETGPKRVVTLTDGSKLIVPTRAGGVMDVSKREATTLVRTSVQTISNNVLMEQYKANSDVLEGVQWLATLDLRTTPLCRERDKKAWALPGNDAPPGVSGAASDEGDAEGSDNPDLLPSDEFPGPPPAHFNCRSVLIPITKTWAKLIKDAGAADSEQLAKDVEEVPDTVRASMDGEVSAGLKYEDWLKEQPVEAQQEVLGQGKWDLWDKGKIGFSDMVDQTGRALTLEELMGKSLGEDAAGQALTRDLEQSLPPDVAELPPIQGGIKGEWEGYGMADLLRYAGNTGLDKDQAYVALRRLGLDPANNTVYIQMKKGALGENVPQLTHEQAAAFKAQVPSKEEAKQLAKDLKKDKVVPPPPPPPPPVPPPKVPEGVTPPVPKELPAGAKPAWEKTGAEIRQDLVDAGFKTKADASREYQEVLGKQLAYKSEWLKKNDPGYDIKQEMDALKARTSAYDRLYSKEYKAEAERLDWAYRKKRGDFDWSAWADTPEGMKLSKQLQDLNEAMNGSSKRMKDFVHNALKLPEAMRAKIEVPFNSDVSNPLIKRKAEEARAWLAERTSKQAIEPTFKYEYIRGKKRLRSEEMKVEVHELPRGARAYQNSGAVFLAPEDGTDIFVHEIGHAFEHRRDEWRKAAAEWLQERAGDEKIRKLKDITGNYGYKDNEVAWEDKFFDPYIGKRYSWADFKVAKDADQSAFLASEVTAMGIQKLFSDPLFLIEKDPEMFDLMVRFLRTGK